jgi:hypothetical protein
VVLEEQRAMEPILELQDIRGEAITKRSDYEETDTLVFTDDTSVFEHFKPGVGDDFVTDLHVKEETEATLTSDQGDGTVDAAIYGNDWDHISGTSTTSTTFSDGTDGLLIA